MTHGIGRKRRFIVQQVIDGQNQALVVMRPVKRKSARACGPGHTTAKLPVVAELFHSGSQLVNLTWGNDEAFDTIADDRPGIGVTTLGKPAASASYVTTADPSNRDGNTNTSAAAIRVGISD